jgi:hypothetical protein
VAPWRILICRRDKFHEETKQRFLIFVFFPEEVHSAMDHTIKLEIFKLEKSDQAIFDIRGPCIYSFNI